MSPGLTAAVENAVAAAAGGGFRLAAADPVAGGCISRNWRIEGKRRRYFLKTGCGAAQYAAEADGLAALAACPLLRVPQVIAAGTAGEEAFLVLEWLDLDGRGDEARLGEAVAALHGIAFPRFGWGSANFIGSTPQSNGWEEEWPRFFAERRLLPQLRLAAANGAPELERRAERLLAGLPRLLAGHSPTARLVHGDLWNGNHGFVAGKPTLFDPAVYAGDPDTDIALAELFGGFGKRFHAAYRALRPADAAYPLRRAVYQLYHLLNHFNLFGGGYRGQAARMIAELSREPA